MQTTIKDVDRLSLYSTSAGPTAAMMWEWRSPNTLAPNTSTPARLQDSVGLRYVYDVNADARVNAAAFDLSTLASGKSLPACPPACTCSRVSLPLHVCLLACPRACPPACRRAVVLGVPALLGSWASLFRSGSSLSPTTGPPV